MREILTAISFLLVIVAPTVMAARASGLRYERPKKKRQDGPITLFRDTTD